MESGYGLVTEEGRPLLLEPTATTQVVDALQNTERERGVRLRATREMQEKAMHTTQVEEV